MAALFEFAELQIFNECDWTFIYQLIPHSCNQRIRRPNFKDFLWTSARSLKDTFFAEIWYYSDKIMDTVSKSRKVCTKMLMPGRSTQLCTLFLCSSIRIATTTAQLWCLQRTGLYASWRGMQLGVKFTMQRRRKWAWDWCQMATAFIGRGKIEIIDCFFLGLTKVATMHPAGRDPHFYTQGIDQFETLQFLGMD